MIAESASIRPGVPFTVAVRFQMDPQWHIYWKNPGDTGLPTTVQWELPPGFSVGPLQWPTPQRILAQGITSYGYTEAVSLLAEVTPPPDLKPGAPVTLRARVGWLACRIECTPGSAELALSLPVGNAEPRPDARWAADFADARNNLPRALQPGAVHVQREQGRIVLAAAGVPATAGSEVFFLPDASGVIKDSAEQKANVNDGRLFLSLAPLSSAPAARLHGVLLVSSAGSSTGYVVDAHMAAPPSSSSILVAIALAFIGGLILNLMPCVLPVVSLKVLSFARHSGEGAAAALRGGLLFAAGVIVSFWLIAGILIALRSAGQLIGWGFQFQSPVIVTITAALFFLVALNLFGVFEVGSVAASAAARASSRRGSLGSFVNGLLATAVATPCTAPFMGGALGFALTQPAAVSMGVFTALALGMAAPYVVLSALPGLVARIPKPGPWMETLRQILAFPMLGAVIWMLWVLQTLSGLTAVPVLLSALLATGLGAWIYGRWGNAARPALSRIVAGSLAAILVLGGTITAAAVVRSTSAPAGSIAASSFWQPWSPERQAGLISQGQAVLVDFTARWCLTCQVNEKVALENPAVRDRLRAMNVSLLRADWTDRSDTITRALAGYGRAGVPLYVLYSAGSSEPVILPEILTPGVLLEQLSARPGR